MKMVGIIVTAFCISLYGAPSLAADTMYGAHYRHHDRHSGQTIIYRYSDYPRHRGRVGDSQIFFGMTFGSPVIHRYHDYGTRYYDRGHHRHYRGCGHRFDRHDRRWRRHHGHRH